MWLSLVWQASFLTVTIQDGDGDVGSKISIISQINLLVSGEQVEFEF